MQPAGIALVRADKDKPIQNNGSFHYVLTRSQVLDNYGEALKFFTAYRDEAAKVRINRILESNAADSIKAKARLLLSYTGVPDFISFEKAPSEDRFSYETVSAEPLLYRDCYVVWKGMAANVIAKAKTTDFTLLVGYDTKTVVQGQVQVHFDAAIPVNPDQPLEVLGKVVPASSPKGVSISLEGLAIHQKQLVK
jgi:hypothetical protein